MHAETLPGETVVLTWHVARCAPHKNVVTLCKARGKASVMMRITMFAHEGFYVIKILCALTGSGRVWSLKALGFWGAKRMGVPWTKRKITMCLLLMPAFTWWGAFRCTGSCASVYTVFKWAAAIETWPAALSFPTGFTSYTCLLLSQCLCARWWCA